MGAESNESQMVKKYDQICYMHQKRNIDTVCSVVTGYFSLREENILTFKIMSPFQFAIL